MPEPPTENASAHAEPADARKPRRWLRRCRWPLMVLLSLILYFSITGCTSTIRAPAAAADPVAVFLLLDDRHRGLVFPDEQGALVEYGYGEWRWYAKLDDSWTDTCRTIFWPSQGTLGRRPTHAHDLESLRRRFHWMHITQLEVERGKLAGLRTRLQAEYAAHKDEEVYNARYRFHFVPHDDGYWLFHNCNDEVAEWFEHLGCSVSWVPIRLGLEVAAKN